MNNFNKIKAMSIDEMAKMFDELNLSCMTSVDCPAGKICEKLNKIKSMNNCIEPFKQWLESESEEERNAMV